MFWTMGAAIIFNGTKWLHPLTGTLSVSVVNSAQLGIQNNDTMPYCAAFAFNFQINSTQNRSDVPGFDNESEMPGFRPQ